MSNKQTMTLSEPETPIDTQEAPWPDQNQAAISLTFDDGMASQLDIAVPMLDAHGLRATFYPIAGDDYRQTLAPWQGVAEAGHEIGSIRGELVIARVEACSLEQAPEVLDAGALVPGWVDGVESDQSSGELYGIDPFSQRLPSCLGSAFVPLIGIIIRRCEVGQERGSGRCASGGRGDRISLDRISPPGPPTLGLSCKIALVSV